jgi:hypothetical protein
MKYISLRIKYSLFAILILTSFSSCTDLDTKPLGTAVDGDLSAGGFEAQAFGLYGQLRSTAVSDWTRYWFQCIRSDDAAKGSSPTDQAEQANSFDNFNYSKTSFLNGNNWNDHYKVIYACNDLIDAIEKSGLTDNGTMVNKAEAKVLRAFLYFDLRRDYGEVPLIENKVVVPSDGVKAKSTVAQVDAFIKADLEFASQTLPASWLSFPGRATKGFANAMLAKLYLYQGNYPASLAKSQEIITSGVYNLEPSYKTLFSIDGNNSKESVFEVQQLVISTGQSFSNNYFVSQGVRGSGVWDLGWGFNVPTPALINAFEVGDPRKGETILTSGQDDGGYGSGTLPAAPPLDQMYWNKKAYTEASVRAKLGLKQNTWENIKIIRYADVLLMAAEAAVQTGNASATGYLNQVRARARGGANVLPNVVATLATIKQERRVEFGMENERFYDLVRWGDAPAVLGGLGYQTKNALYPIPQTAIDQAQGVLLQNPNY